MMTDMELKARHVVDVYDNYSEHPCKESSQVYLKSEADKVIAELKNEIEHLDAHLAGFLKLEEEHGGGDLRKYINNIRRENNELFTSNWSLKGTNKVLDELLKEKQRECRHQKYKRCLAMAIWCRRNRLHASVCGPVEKIDFWEKWRKRWLELAEKFKEAK